MVKGAMCRGIIAKSSATTLSQRCRVQMVVGRVVRQKLYAESKCNDERRFPNPVPLCRCS